MWKKKNVLRWMVALRLNHTRTLVGFCAGFFSWVIVNWLDPSQSHYVSVLEQAHREPDYRLLLFAPVGIPIFIWILATWTFRFKEHNSRPLVILVSFYGGAIFSSFVYLIAQIFKESSAFL